MAVFEKFAVEYNSLLKSYLSSFLARFVSGVKTTYKQRYTILLSPYQRSAKAAFIISDIFPTNRENNALLEKYALEVAEMGKIKD